MLANERKIMKSKIYYDNSLFRLLLIKGSSFIHKLFQIKTAVGINDFCDFSL